MILPGLGQMVGDCRRMRLDVADGLGEALVRPDFADAVQFRLSHRRPKRRHKTPQRRDKLTSDVAAINFSVDDGNPAINSRLGGFFVQFEDLAQTQMQGRAGHDFSTRTDKSLYRRCRTVAR